MVTIIFFTILGVVPMGKCCSTTGYKRSRNRETGYSSSPSIIERTSFLVCALKEYWIIRIRFGSTVLADMGYF
ncbi:hypothetical protein H206_05463 [Candidatus Electrothrix aarhusensis]|uniref:Uncharacterized protein n=1 Tax=Candidatus Electrothrix aarhusensis TaxID=1859131 RepID=A0A3S3R1M4_9BACT|nr:hypothetical protein H206_05463 [Candidatus Electrothrix aarhusensis]